MHWVISAQVSVALPSVAPPCSARIPSKADRTCGYTDRSVTIIYRSRRDKPSESP